MLSTLPLSRNRTRNAPTLTARCCLCLSSRLCPLVFPRLEDPHSHFYLLPLLHSFLTVSSMAFSTCFSRCLFLSAFLLSPSVSSFLPLASPYFFRTSLTHLACGICPWCAYRAAWTRHWASIRVRPCVRSNGFV